MKKPNFCYSCQRPELPEHVQGREGGVFLAPVASDAPYKTNPKAGPRQRHYGGECTVRGQVDRRWRIEEEKKRCVSPCSRHTRGLRGDNSELVYILMRLGVRTCEKDSGKLDLWWRWRTLVALPRGGAGTSHNSFQWVTKKYISYFLNRVLNFRKVFLVVTYDIFKKWVSYSATLLY